MEPNWSLLPPELIQATVEKITSLADYIRFRAVCHPWRSATSPRPLHLPVQLPWLMLPYYNGSDKPYYYRDQNSTRLFYDLSSSKIHCLDLPETRDVDVCGSSHGWLFLHDGSVTSLLNPLTHATIPLPPYTVPPATFMPDDDDQVAGKNGLKPTKRFRVYKAMLTSSPLDPGCLVFVTISSTWLLAFCKIGDECWTVIESKYSWHFGVDSIQDICYSSGFLCAIGYYANLTVYNMNSPSKLSVPGYISPDSVYLVEGTSDEMCYIGPDRVHLVEGTSDDILFIEYRNLDGVLPIESEYTVYKLSIDEVPKIIEVTDIGQKVFFLVGKCRTLSFSTADLQLPEWFANCICYDSKWIEHAGIFGGTSYNHNIRLARVDDGTVTDLTDDLGIFQKEYWQSSLWLTPSLL